MTRVAWPIAIAALIILHGTNVRTLLTPDLNDYGRFWASSRAVLDGRSPYFGPPRPENPPRPMVDSNLNPPHLVWAMAPLGLVTPKAGLVIWAAVSVAAAIANLRILTCASPSSTYPLVVFALAIAATGAIVKTGQLAFLLAFPMALSWRASRENRAIAAGAWLGVCLSVKPFLIVFPVVWILQRRWRWALAALAVSGAVFAFGLVVIGTGAYAEWLRMLNGIYWSSIGLNMSAVGLGERLLGGANPDYRPLWLAPAAILPVVAGLLSCCAGYCAWMLRRRTDSDHEYLGIGLIALLVSPLGWVYYLWLFISPLALLTLNWLRSRDYRSERAIVATALLCVPPRALTIGQPNGVLTLTLGSAYFWAGVLILWSLATDLQDRRAISNLADRETPLPH